MRAATGRWSHFRRTRRVAAGVFAAGVLTLAVAGPGAAQDSGEEFNRGTGQAVASGYTVNPIFGNLSFGITAGLSIAGHQNTEAQAISKSIDTGVIGQTMAGEGCAGGDPTWASKDQPQPVMAESSDPDASEGYEGTEEGVIHKFAWAIPDPFGEAITTVAPLGDEAVAEIRGGRVTASSGVIDGSLRQATAITEIGSLNLVGGLVRIGDMRWEAIHRTGEVDEVIGTFTFGSLEIAGEEQELEGDDARRLEELNVALRELGFEIIMPRVRQAQGFIFVDPMKIGIIPSEIRDSLLGPVFEQTQDFREQLADFLLEQSCSFGTFITVADLALGSVSGAGSLHLEVGGVRATTAELQMFEFPELPPLPDLDATPVVPQVESGGLAPAAPSSPAPSRTTGSSDTPSAGGTTEQATTPPPQETSTERSDEVAAMPTEPIADITGTRGGWLAAISGLGLAALLITAEADRRKMRRAMRQIPLEA